MSEGSSEGENPVEKVKEKVALGRNYWRLWTASVVANLGDGVALIAYPWLASAVTRNALLIALIAVAQRIPWLVFALPAGVITDRFDRRKIMTSTSLFRAALTVGVAVVVLMHQGVLPSPEDVTAGIAFGTNMTVYFVLLISALLFGFAEVLYDNSAQTILPAIVEPKGLEKANARLWGAEMVMNHFAGPPLGSVLIGFAFALPFFFNAGTFAVAAVLIFALSGVFRVDRVAGQEAGGEAAESDRPSFWADIKEGITWLWAHPLLRPMAIIAGFMNGLSAITAATIVLFAQEALGVTTTTFAFLMMMGAAGGVLGSVLAPKISEKLGSGTSLFLVMLSAPVTALAIGLSTHWVVAGAIFFLSAIFLLLWNVIVVSLRQTIIPGHLLGRVNSVYRLFAWGALPIGLGIGGAIVSGAEAFGVDRVMALRLPYFIVAAASFLLLLWATPRLTTEKIEAARAAGRVQ